MSKINAAIVGFGRMGQIHYNNMVKHLDDYNVVAISDPYINKYKKDYDFKDIELLTNWEEIYNFNIDAVVIATPAVLHPDIILKSIENDKHIFCEKPVAREGSVLSRLQSKIKDYSKKVQIGINRRFDPGVIALKKQLDKINKQDIVCLKITSHDPEPPSYSYIKDSGGIYHDMIVHDYDMACYLMQKKVKSVQSSASVLIDENIIKYKEFDTVVSVVVFEDDSTAVIYNSRQAAYGYDQRIEVITNKDKFSTVNHYQDNVRLLNKNGLSGPRLKEFFLERYQESYVNELKYFADSIINDKPVVASVDDIINAFKLADAAKLSNTQGQKADIEQVA